MPQSHSGYSVVVVERDPSVRISQCTLEDGSAVLLCCKNWTDARIASAGVDGLEIVRREELTERDRRRIEQAI